MSDPGTQTSFDWRVFADATCAGLTALIPLPILDLAFEAYFRRRMPDAIARVRGRRLERLAALRLGRARLDGGHFPGCLSLPLAAVRYVLGKVWRKVVYVLAVADATSQVSFYWHRAYLIDHMVRAGHLDPGTDLERATAVLGRVLREADTSPLRGLACEVVTAGRRVLRLLVRARRRGSASEAGSLGEILRDHWGAAERSLQSLALRYDQLYACWPAGSGLGGGLPRRFET